MEDHTEFDQNTIIETGAKHTSTQVPKRKTIHFNSIIKIPKEYELELLEIENISYNLNDLSLIQETGKKAITIEDYGETEVELYMLKAKGTISFIANIDVVPKAEYKSKIGFKNNHINNYITISIIDNIPIDQVLKYSLKPLGNHVIDIYHIHLKELKITSISPSEKNLLRLSGMFVFSYE
ncbi:hypothetical protein FA950_30430 [Bacillus thuringiensis]|uniref:hypothetical protein n=1 Tax=Bacillus thuringiensis TaxID=1428 RepID=UPI0010AD6A27|nr:hypothetical protein [Bacillus thuringiensis]TJZ99552.1 hypothetical protein FA950_30430 [Bacillus thuringiensis]